MTRRNAAPRDSFLLPGMVEQLERTAAEDESTRHLRFLVRGNRILAVSCDPPDVEHHARFSYLGADRWTLDIHSHTGRWNATGAVGHPAELLRMLRDDFPWVVTPRDVPL